MFSINEERGSIIKKGVVLIYQLADLQERREQNTSPPECTFLSKTHFDGVLSKRNVHVLEFQSFVQVEEDTLILLHMDNETVHGHSKACDRLLDSEIVILAVRFFETLGLSELRVGFFNGKRNRDIPVHSLHSDAGVKVPRTDSVAQLKRDATRLPSFQGCAVARIQLVHSGPVFPI